MSKTWNGQAIASNHESTEESKTEVRRERSRSRENMSSNDCKYIWLNAFQPRQATPFIHHVLTYSLDFFFSCCRASNHNRPEVT